MFTIKSAIYLRHVSGANSMWHPFSAIWMPHRISIRNMFQIKKKLSILIVKLFILYLDLVGLLIYSRFLGVRQAYLGCGS